MKKRIAGAVLAISMTASLITPFLAGATNSTSADYSTYSIEQLEALITKLQKQLAEMKKGAKCFVSDKELSIGDGEGDDGFAEDVRRLQEFLREKGHLKYKSTGYFGKLTRAAVVAFQKASGIPQNGMFDDETREKAHALYCKKAVAVASTVKKEQPKIEPKEEAKKPGVTSITLKVDGGLVVWSTVGHAAQGFKVVWSRKPGPTYPNRESDYYQYLGDPGASKTEIEPFDGAGTYYVRVCEYVGGACGTYSNEVKVTR